MRWGAKARHIMGTVIIELWTECEFKRNAARKTGRRPADDSMTFGYEAAGQADKPHHNVDHEQT